MNNIDLMNYWIKSSDEDYNVMNILYNSKKNSYCLFFWANGNRKIIKSYICKK